MEYILRPNDFITETVPAYSDPEGNEPYKIKIVGLPSNGELEYNGTAVTVNQEFDYPQSLVNGILKYITEPENYQAYIDTVQFQVSDTGSRLYSNIGNIRFNVKEIVSPTVEDNILVVTERSNRFTEGSFIKGFSDPDGDSYYEVKIKTIPTASRLTYLGNTVEEGRTFLVENTTNLFYNPTDAYATYDGVTYRFEKGITNIIRDHTSTGYRLTDNKNGRLTFTLIEDTSEKVEIQGEVVRSEEFCFIFTTSDDSPERNESNEAEFCIIPVGDINIKAPYDNKPPTSGTTIIQVEEGEEITFNIHNFAFEDPEGDEPSIIRIDNLPTEGIITLWGNELYTAPITINVDLIKEGRLKYKADVKYTQRNEIINFGISDTGSGQFANGTINVRILTDYTPPSSSSIYSYQFDGLTHNATDFHKITEELITTEGLYHTEQSLLDGKEITYTKLGRIVWAIKTNTPRLYKFKDKLGNDMTNTVFNNHYDSVNHLDIYISRSYYTPGMVIDWQFEKN